MNGKSGRLAECGMEKAVRSAGMERESVQECVRMSMWTREASVVGEDWRVVGGGGAGEGLMSGMGVGVCVWRCGGKGGGRTVVVRFQPGARRREARKKCFHRCFEHILPLPT